MKLKITDHIGECKKCGAPIYVSVEILAPRDGDTHHDHKPDTTKFTCYCARRVVKPGDHDDLPPVTPHPNS